MTELWIAGLLTTRLLNAESCFKNLSEVALGKAALLADMGAGKLVRRSLEDLT